MRVLGFERHWPKLDQETFTTFRYPRKDADMGRDWRVGEVVQCVVNPRSPKREPVCIAEIVGKDIARHLATITDDEAKADGFPIGFAEMMHWLLKKYPGMDVSRPINKLTLRRVPRPENHS